MRTIQPAPEPPSPPSPPPPEAATGTADKTSTYPVALSQLPAVVQDDLLERLMAQFGPVRRVAVAREKKKKDAGGEPARCRGTAQVFFDTAAAAQAAKAAAAVVYEGVPIKISLAKKDRGESSQTSEVLGAFGLPLFLTEDDLLNAVKERSSMVTHVSVVKDKTTGKSKGFGFVYFASAEDARVFMDGSGSPCVRIKGLPIRFDYSLTREPRECDPRAGKPQDSIPKGRPCNVLGCFGLHKQATEADIDALFSPYGQIIKIDIVMDKTTGNCKGYGFIYFAKTEDATRVFDAIQTGELVAQVHGQPMRVDYSLTTSAPRTRAWGEEPASGFGDAGGGGGGRPPRNDPNAPKTRPCNVLGCFGLPKSATEADVCALFAPYGQVVKTDVVIDKNTLRCKGYGFVYFQSTDGAMRAYDAIQCGALLPMIHGQQVRVDYSLTTAPPQTRREEPDRTRNSGESNVMDLLQGAGAQPVAAAGGYAGAPGGWPQPGGGASIHPTTGMTYDNLPADMLHRFPRGPEDNAATTNQPGYVEGYQTCRAAFLSLLDGMMQSGALQWNAAAADAGGGALPQQLGSLSSFGLQQSRMAAGGVPGAAGFPFPQAPNPPMLDQLQHQMHLMKQASGSQLNSNYAMGQAAALQNAGLTLPPNMLTQFLLPGADAAAAAAATNAIGEQQYWGT
eukprot:TRINITY_DN1312_c3_g1_i1.p1 TRINITY_DN1312_c3_g1~~TRINITY_DN1312_c3_g1_i1.p1  ORF type:complete len:676 (+),score=224.23 TRINITY_DN1312_c3_g1_i1:277-2304(+)